LLIFPTRIADVEEPVAAAPAVSAAKPLDIAAHLAARAGLFRIALQACESPVRRWPEVAAGVAVPGAICGRPSVTMELTEGERLLTETVEGQQLFDAMANVVPAFRGFANAGFYADRLMTRVYAGMRRAERMAFIRRVLELAAARQGAPMPQTDDESLARFATHAGIHV
jgi:hypothetical protein